MLNRVIITRNVIFDENILYSVTREQEEGQLIVIIRDVIKLNKEDEIQDTGLIFENVTLESEAYSERRETELSAPGDITSSF